MAAHVLDRDEDSRGDRRYGLSAMLAHSRTGLIRRTRSTTTRPGGRDGMTAGDERLLFDGVAEPFVGITWSRQTSLTTTCCSSARRVCADRCSSGTRGGFHSRCLPPAGAVGRRTRFADWGGRSGKAAQQWSRLAEDGDDPLPELIVEEWASTAIRAPHHSSRLQTGGIGEYAGAVDLHAVADEACAGLFVALDRSDGHGVAGTELVVAGVSENRVVGSFAPSCCGCCPKSNAADWKGVVLTIRLRPWRRVMTRWHKLPVRHRTDPQAGRGLLLP